MFSLSWVFYISILCSAFDHSGIMGHLCDLPLVTMPYSLQDMPVRNTGMYKILS